VQEGWTSKIQEQSNEGCNIAGGVRVNKVVGNFHFSPGRSFQTHVHHVHALVPYLKDQNHHNFGHTIHHFAFEGDDEYSAHKANLGTWFKEKMGIEYNPLDGVYGMVGFRIPHVDIHLIVFEDTQPTGDVPILPQGCLDKVYRH
jgi:endoplasmic reticulum-Golgi intermediate compartment protein 3